MKRKRGWNRPQVTRVPLYPTAAEQERAIGAHEEALQRGEEAYFAARASEHRKLGFETGEHRAANAHHLLASLYEALAERSRDRSSPQERR